jgi:hypothetical protein
MAAQLDDVRVLAPLYKPARHNTGAAYKIDALALIFLSFYQARAARKS